MPNYTLELELFSSYVTDVPEFEIWADGALLGSSYSVTSGGYSISVSPSYGGSLPTSLEFRFNDVSVEVPRTIEIRSVKINNMYVNTGNYLSSNSLINGGSSTVDIDSVNTNDSDFIFDASDPATSEFTTGATETFTAGNDTYRRYNDTDDEVFAMLAGGDVAYLGSGDDKVSGGAGNDIIYGSAGADLLYGDGGNDRLYGGDDNDTLYGGLGNDRIHGQGGNDEIHGGDGDDRLNGHDGDDVITGGIGADNLNGGAGIDYLFGGDDNDQIVGADGNDTIDGGDGNDLIYGGAGADHIDGGNGADVLIGNGGADIINGGADNDTIYLMTNDWAAGEAIYGGAGTDELILTHTSTVDFTTGTLAELETLTGSDGDQDVTYTIQQALNFLTIDLAGGTDNSRVNVTGTVDVTALGTPTVSNAENGFITGSAGNDELTITGAQLDALVYGTGIINFNAGGSDTINITSTSADLNALGATDVLILGLEEISAITAAASVIINVIGQTENLTLTGSIHNDTITGGAGDDTIDAAQGSDIVNAGSGNDTIYGRGGVDTINGEAGNDFIRAGDGNDIISGGIGIDDLRGENGNDTINLANGDFVAGESIDGGANTDEITFTNATTVDFTTGTLSNLETLTGSTGNDDVTIEINTLGQFVTADLAGGIDVIRTQIDGVYDATVSGIPTVSNTENGFLVGSANADTLTANNTNLANLIYGTGTIDMGAGSDTINIVEESTLLNTLGLTDGSINNLETISASTVNADLTIDMSAQSEDLILIGGTGRNTILGGSGDDTITGNADDDTFTGGAGVDNIVGDEGIDEFNLANGDFAVGEILNGGIDNDIIILTNATTVDFQTGTLIDIEELEGSGGNDIVTVSATQYVAFNRDIDLRGGTDIFNVFADNSDISAFGDPAVTTEIGNLIGDGADNSITLTGNQLNRILVGSGIVDLGGGTNDVINLTSQSNDLNTLGSSSDADVLGVETISFSTATANLTLDMSAQSEDLILIGGTGRNTILGGSGDDTITGNADDDTFTGGAGVDNIVGDEGIDEFNLANGDFAVGEILNGGIDNDIIILTNATTVDFQTGTLIDIEELEGSGGNDIVTVSATQYVAFNRDIDLRGGTDIFNVFADNSDISAFGDPAVTTEIGNLIGDGADNSITLTGNQLNRILVGSGIVDLGGGTNDVINLTSQSNDLNTLGSSSDADVLGVETISFSTATANLTLDMSAQSEDLILIGGTGRNTILGGSGDDTITGNADDDTFTGGIGSDLITGGSGDDTIYALDTVMTNDDDRLAVNTLNGGIGNDTLYGSTGTDTLNGDAGDDVLRSNSVAGVSSTIISALISTGNDDSEEDIATGDIFLSSSDLELGDDDFHGGPQLVGLRWQDINIAQGTVITNAYIEFNADESTSSAIDLTFYGEDVDSAATFTATDYDISSRTTTTASVDWNSVPSWTAGNYYQTPDLSSIIQEIVDRGGWTSGSSDLAIIVSGTTGVERIAEAYEGDGQPARLVIEYGGSSSSVTILNGGAGNDTLYGGAGTDTLNGGDGDDELRSNSVTTTATEDVLISASDDDAEERASNGSMNLTSTDLEMIADGGTDQIVGLRWQNLDIAQGAQITNAYVEFQADESDSSAINLTFHGQDTDSALAFTTNNSDISSRTTTTNSVTWNSVPSWTTGSTYQTPDLSSIIQEIIDRGGWTAGTSDLAIIVSGTAGAARVADSFNGNGTPARLVIEYTDSNSDVTTLNGQDGLDDLYGGAGIDHFVFEAASAFNDVDTITGFDTTDYDALDISDVLIGYTAGVDDITDWIQITDDGTDSTLAIDANGTTGGSSYSDVATLIGVTGLTDEAALEASGNIIA